MGESPRPKTAVPTERPSHAAFLLITTALDTTWRTLVPGIAGTILGIILDRTVNTIPLFTIIGLIIGIGLSALLIYRQFKAVR